jgi:hypothetical protein
MSTDNSTLILPGRAGAAPEGGTCHDRKEDSARGEPLLQRLELVAQRRGHVVAE